MSTSSQNIIENGINILSFDLDLLKKKINSLFVKSLKNREYRKIRVSSHFNAGEYAIEALLIEGNFTVEGKNLVLDWSELDFDLPFHDAHYAFKDLYQDDQEEIGDICSVSHIILPTEEAESRAMLCLVEAFNEIVDYRTEIGDYDSYGICRFGFRFDQIKASYQEARKKNVEMVDFDLRLSEYFDGEIKSYLNHIEPFRKAKYSLKKEEVSKDEMKPKKAGDENRERAMSSWLKLRFSP